MLVADVRRISDRAVGYGQSTDPATDFARGSVSQKRLCALLAMKLADIVTGD